MAQVVCSQISKSFGTAKVLNRVDLQVEDGEFVVILGPSGCGKSTLLRIISGIEHQDGGTISIGGDLVDNVHPRERNLAMVFQNYALYPLMNVFDNMAFSQRIRKRNADEIRSHIEEVAATLGLTEHLDKRPGELSGGQRQRVAMGRAMVRNPRVFLFDEPLSNLDARLRAKMRAEIKALHIALKTTTIYVTHDQIEAMTMGDRIAVMRNSVIVQLGTPSQIYEQPINLHVATFIGSPEINVLRAQVVAGKCQLNGMALPLPHPVPDGEVTYCIRPHNLKLAVAGGTDTLVAKIDFVEPTGNYGIVHATLSGVKIVLQVGADELQGLHDGETFHLQLNPSKVLLFHTSTEERL